MVLHKITYETQDGVRTAWAGTTRLARKARKQIRENTAGLIGAIRVDMVTIPSRVKADFIAWLNANAQGETAMEDTAPEQEVAIDQPALPFPAPAVNDNVPAPA